MAQATGGPLVSVENLGRRYGAFWAVKGLTFDVREGEIFGLIGPNGAGKTTTLKTLAGLLAPTEGRAHVAGLNVDDPRLKARVGYLPEESPLYDDMNAKQYLRFFADLYELPRKVAGPRAEQLLADLRFDAAERKIGDMSKGQRRKVAIARSLINDPSVLIYDEPASGLDTVVSAYVLDLIQSLRARGKTVIFSAHNLYHVERICDRILILSKGRAIVGGSMAEIRATAGGTEYRVRLSVALPGTTPSEGAHQISVTDFAAVARLEREAQDAGGRLLDVRTTDLPLEEIFLRTTGGAPDPVLASVSR